MDLIVALSDWLGRIEELLEVSDDPADMRRRVTRMQRELVRPILTLVGGREDRDGRQIRALFRAVEDYAAASDAHPDRRLKRRRRVEQLASAVRRQYLSGGALPLAGNRGRVTDPNGGGHPACGDAVCRMVRARNVKSRCRGQPFAVPPIESLTPYGDAVRPRDRRGEPGGLIIVHDAARAIVVGDLHGRYDNLEAILQDKDNLRAVREGRAHLVFTGDAIHPAHSAINDAASYENSFRTMFLIMMLKARRPRNVHYLVGNHDHAHVGGLPTSRGDVRQDLLFEKFAVERFGREVFEHYREFVRRAPVALKLGAPNGYLILVHAGLTPRVASDEDLINIHLSGPQAPGLWDVLWNRKYDDGAMLEECLKRVGAKLMVTGHTPPTRRRLERYRLEPIFAPVFAHVHHRQVILNAQANVFGYLDLDLTVPLPDDATDLRAPDGMSAFRLLRQEGSPSPSGGPG